MYVIHLIVLNVQEKRPLNSVLASIRSEPVRGASLLLLLAKTQTSSATNKLGGRKTEEGG